MYLSKSSVTIQGKSQRKKLETKMVLVQMVTILRSMRGPRVVSEVREYGEI